VEYSLLSLAPDFIGFAEVSSAADGNSGPEDKQLKVDVFLERKEMRLEAMAVTIPHVEGHPNRVPFEGVLTVVNSASDKAPAGARGHRVILTREAAGTGMTLGARSD
jgi:hypothetical protein